MRLIDADALRQVIAEAQDCARLAYIDLVNCEDKRAVKIELGAYAFVHREIDKAPTIDPESLRAKGLYTAHEVAEIIADLFGDCCACNFNDIDEWLPSKCELLDDCPNPVGVACWEQYLKYRDEKMEG